MRSPRGFLAASLLLATACGDPSTAATSANHEASGVITVVAGTYGGNCGAPHGNVTAQLAKPCDDRASCDYTVDYQVLGDPKEHCGKDYVAEWTCGQDDEIQRAELGPEAGYGGVVHLFCR
jgi:hypothetical protein